MELLRATAYRRTLAPNPPMEIIRTKYLDLSGFSETNQWDFSVMRQKIFRPVKFSLSKCLNFVGSVPYHNKYTNQQKTNEQFDFQATYVHTVRM